MIGAGFFRPDAQTSEVVSALASFFERLGDQDGFTNNVHNDAINHVFGFQPFGRNFFFP